MYLVYLRRTVHWDCTSLRTDDTFVFPSQLRRRRVRSAVCTDLRWHPACDTLSVLVELLAPANKKHNSSREKDTSEDALSGHHIRGWRAVSVAGLQGKGSREKKELLVQAPATKSNARGLCWSILIYMIYIYIYVYIYIYIYTH